MPLKQERPEAPSPLCSDARLFAWLDQRGLWGNPFAIWNAERDPNLPRYFVDVGQLDELLHRSRPCIMFASRGYGKTAESQMLAAHCRPQRPGSMTLAVSYTYAGFERTLAAASDDLGRLQPVYYVVALLQQAFQVLMGAMRWHPQLMIADAIYAALVLASIPQSQEIGLADLVAPFEKWPQPLIFLSLPERFLTQALGAIEERIREYRARLGPDWQMLAWRSSTEPGVIRLMVEGGPQQQLQDVQEVAWSICRSAQDIVGEDRYRLMSETLSKR